jgi:nucleotide-binding universal stress UspA family protein
MISRILLAVDDSPGSLQAARLGIEMAHALGAAVRAVTVVADGATGQLGGAMGTRRVHAAVTVLGFVATLAGRSELSAETVQLGGEPAAQIIDQARAWPADVIVIGRSRQPGTGQQYVGSQTREVLEFADVPVLVVPTPGPDRVLT